ncbi:SPOSA6832_00596 [Sporobolomyces salmonicolor]|uniref:Putative lipoate-protein ligase A n=1 Tax=Sporidiobolus salmonicolor TaxID=5005 RepID=A0A0D6EHQ1_SPOSA|nr:SPOSA6832_00596 [Sporobolomyces salmonicolor]
MYPTRTIRFSTLPSKTGAAPLHSSPVVDLLTHLSTGSFARPTPRKRFSTSIGIGPALSLGGTRLVATSLSTEVPLTLSPNPWKEINLARLQQLGIPFVRRKSGGGTVYHDLGNTNYCVFVPRLEFERKTNAELVVAALNKLEIPAYVNDRNDICVDSFKMSPPSAASRSV